MTLRRSVGGNAKASTNVMYVDYKFWYDTKDKVVTLDEEMNLNIPNGEMFEFRNNQFFPILNTSRQLDLDWDEKRMDIIGQTETMKHYSVDDDEIWEAMSLKGILYENKEDGKINPVAKYSRNKSGAGYHKTKLSTIGKIKCAVDIQENMK